MCYEDRLRQYKEEKRRLQSKNLSDEEYMRAIIKLANKWRV
jgi:lipase chaperone LimK